MEAVQHHPQHEKAAPVWTGLCVTEERQGFETIKTSKGVAEKLNGLIDSLKQIGFD